MRKERKVGRRILIPVVNLLSEILEPEVLLFSDIFFGFYNKGNLICMKWNDLGMEPKHA